MIDRQTLLVARREFIENARTKTFWIGILSLPLILVLAVGISVLLEGARETRRYAVLDQSGFLAEEVQQLSDQSDTLKAFKDFLTAIGKELKGQEKATGAEIIEIARKVRDQVADTEIERTVIDLTLEQIDPEAEIKVSDFTVAPKQMVEQFQELSGSQIAALDGRLDKERYERVSLEDLGVEDKSDVEKVREVLNKKIASESLFAYIVVPKDPVMGKERSQYVSNNVSDTDLASWFERHATVAVRNARIEEFGIDPSQAAALRQDFSLENRKVSDSGDDEDVDNTDKASGFAPVAFVYLLWIAIFTAANMLLTNTVEEKSNRLIEVLLSSVSPNQLMSGKILGIGATGLTIVVTWALTAVLGAPFIKGGPFEGVDLTAIIADPLYLGSFIGYFLAGYLLYGAILVAMGSVCNSLKEAQNLMQPVMMILIVPLLAMIFVVQQPNGTVAKVLTYIPFYTPFLMMNRAGGPPATWEYIVSTLLIIVSVWFAFRAAAKIFRVGVLMTGKPPKLGEIIRWLRAPSGHVPTRRND